VPLFNHYTPLIIFPKEKRKKKKAIYQVEGCKDARAVRNEPFIHPCFFVSLELTFAALFISFGLISTATLWGGGRGFGG